MQPAERQGTSTTSGTTSPSTSWTPAASAPATLTISPGLLSPGSTGTITATADENRNTVLDVKLEHLPPPANLDPTLTTYVVWIRPRAGGEQINVGQLQIEPDRTGRLRTTTPHVDFDLIVSGETTGSAREPSKFVVLKGSATRP